MQFEPDEVSHCDGVFLSGYKVQCNGLSVTGELDVIKKVPYKACIALRNKRYDRY